MRKQKKVTVKNPPTVEHIFSERVKAVVWQNAGPEEVSEPAILIESWGNGQPDQISIMQGDQSINLNISTLQAMPEILAHFAARHKAIKEDAERAEQKSERTKMNPPQPPQPAEPNATEVKTCEHGFIIGQCLACYLSEYGTGRPTRREIAVQFALKFVDRMTVFVKPMTASDICGTAVEYTDALLAELEKGKSK